MISTFKNINGEPVIKVNLLIRQLALLYNKGSDLRFISFDQVKTARDSIIKFIKASFDEAKEQCVKNVDNSKTKFSEINR